MKDRKKMLARLAANGRWYSIKNQAGPVAEVRIYDEISFWGITAEDFVADLKEITAPEIVVAINSPGGDVFDGIAIYNALRNHPAKITTRVDGLAASAASVIFQAGDRRVMMSGSQVMIHEAWGLTIGFAADMREFADLLDRQSDVIAGIYANRTQGEHDAAHFRALMGKGEAWFTDVEAVEAGLADEVSDPQPNEQPTARTLNDEIAAAVDANAEILDRAERVAALRAEKGKGLSEVNRESLVELRAYMARLDELVGSEAAENHEDEVPDEIVEAARREFMAFVKEEAVA